VPQAVDVTGILTYQQRRMAGLNAAGNQLVAWQVRAGAGKAAASFAAFCLNL
jgi:hypothetical protein